jgi:hypothetical protein
MHNEEQFNLDIEEINDAEYVLRHAPNTIDSPSIGIDMLDILRKTIDEWIEEKQ